MPAAPGSLLARIGLPTRSSWLAVLSIGAFVALAAVSIAAANQTLVAAKDWVVGYFDWLFVALATAAIAAVGVLAIWPRANVRLGPEDSQPEFGRLSWFAMLFSAGLASGLLYWAAAEPILHQQDNPFLTGSGDDGVRSALRITVLHWGFHGWAFYVLAGLAIAYFGHRKGYGLSFRTALVPVLGARQVDRWPGRAVDLIALFGTVCGVSTSIGISAGGMNATLGSLFGVDVTIPTQIGIVFGVCILGILSALSGLDRGIRRLSELNVWVSAGLLAAFVALGPTGFLLELFGRTLVDYAVHFVPTGLYVADDAEGRSWQASWTVFYWAWWLAWTPFVSLFIARISRGRTVREFVVAVMGVPTLVTLVWMTMLGGTALHQELAVPGSVSAAVAEDYSKGLVAVIGNLASPEVGRGLVVVAAFLLFTWLITSLDSATLVVCHLVGAREAPGAKVFWGLSLAVVTVALLRLGGLEALQAASIVIGLPLALLIVPLGVGLFGALAREGGGAPAPKEPGRAS